MTRIATSLPYTEKPVAEGNYGTNLFRNEPTRMGIVAQPRMGAMNNRMLAKRNDSQVFNSVIGSIFIKVMNVFTPKKEPSQVFFHNLSMKKFSSLVISKVTLICHVISALISGRVITSLTLGKFSSRKNLATFTNWHSTFPVWVSISLISSPVHNGIITHEGMTIQSI